MVGKRRVGPDTPDADTGSAALRGSRPEQSSDEEPVIRTKARNSYLRVIATLCAELKIDLYSRDAVKQIEDMTEKRIGRWSTPIQAGRVRARWIRAMDRLRGAPARKSAAASANALMWIARAKALMHITGQRHDCGEMLCESRVWGKCRWHLKSGRWIWPRLLIWACSWRAGIVWDCEFHSSQRR